MKLRFLLLKFLSAGLLFAESPEVVPVSTKQIIVVLAPNWTSPKATMQRFERAGVDWRQVGNAMSCVIGKSGMAWVIGLHSSENPDLASLQKREGDLKSPAGIFSLGTSMGYAGSLPFPAKIPYVQSTATTLGIDDEKSTRYNTIVDTLALPSDKPPDWQSFEKMRRDDVRYKWLILIRHNEHNTLGCGSLIFLHVWQNSDTLTTGCTAMSEQDVLTTLAWLETNKNPVILQLPVAEYQKVAKNWGLPEIDPAMYASDGMQENPKGVK